MVCHSILDSVMKSLKWRTLSNALLASEAGTNTALLCCAKQLLSVAPWKQHWRPRPF